MSGGLDTAAKAWLTAPHGQRARVVESLADELGVSRCTAHRRLAQATRGLRPRKRREDADALSLSRREAEIIAMTVNETRRRTGTGELCLDDAVAVLRANKQIRAERCDEATGELIPLSTSAIRRAMKAYGMDSGTLAQTTPSTRLASPHPNWCWQIDASVSRQFYLDDGVEQMDRIKYYRGKPENFERIARKRLLRYVITDHYSGAMALFYVVGGESAEALLKTMMYTLVPRPGSVLYGVPRFLMTDPGSGMIAQPCRNFCRSLGIELIVNKTGNARAKGQVERQQGLVETKFEALMKLAPTLHCLDEIQEAADKWSVQYNATSRHTRTGVSRQAAWLRITSEQLVMAPDVKTLASLANRDPIPRRIRDWRIKHEGALWNVEGLRDRFGNGDRVEVVCNALDPNTLRVLIDGEDGQVLHYLAPRVNYDEGGFESTAAIIGQTYHAAPESPADAQRKQLERLAMQVDTDAEAVLARRAGRRALQGLEPFAAQEQAPAPTPLPRAGQASTVRGPSEHVADTALPGVAPSALGVTLPVLGHVAMARALRDRLADRGVTWTGEHYQRMAALWPEGVPESEIDDCVPTLLRDGLRAVRAVGAQ